MNNPLEIVNKEQSTAPVDSTDKNRTVKNLLLSALRRYNSQSKFRENFTLDASGIKFKENYNKQEKTFAFYIPVKPLNHVIDLVRDIEPLDYRFGGTKSKAKRFKIEYLFDSEEQEYLVISHYRKPTVYKNEANPLSNNKIKIQDI